MAISNQQVKIRGESINHVVHNQFNHSKVANSSTQAIFLDPNGLSLWPLHSPLKVFVYLPLKETFSIFIALAITYLVWLSNSDLYHIENSNFLWHISRPKCPQSIEWRFSDQNWPHFPYMSEFPPVLPTWVSYRHQRATIRFSFLLLLHFHNSRWLVCQHLYHLFLKLPPLFSWTYPTECIWCSLGWLFVTSSLCFHFIYHIVTC